MHRTRNAAYPQGYREFESPPIRQFPRMSGYERAPGLMARGLFRFYPATISYRFHAVFFATRSYSVRAR